MTELATLKDKTEHVSSILSFKIENAEFEGPLDLLLHLISKHKLNICDIEISSLVQQYMTYISLARENDMELASEFIEMASRLIYIKSIMLLPKYEEEKEILKKELEGQLIEYSLCKAVANILSKMDVSSNIFTFKGEEIEADYTYHGIHESVEILSAYMQFVTKKKNAQSLETKTFEPIVARKIVSVKSRAIFLLNILYKKQKVHLDECFHACENRSELVATFLAVLDLIKTKRILISQDNYIRQGHIGGEYFETEFTEK
ncbi:MAG: segregation/condensation protein A [Oscillospiraceae bacterium]